MTALLLKNLGVVCPNCEFLNVAGAVRCMACQAATDGSTARSEPPGLKRTGEVGAPVVAPPGPIPAPSASATTSPSLPVLEAPAPAPAPVAETGPRFGLSVMSGPSRGQKYKLGPKGAQIGQSKGLILFPDDPFISPLHASLTVKDGTLTIKDENSSSGVFVSISGQETVPGNSVFCAGLRVFRYVGPVEPSAPWNKSDVLVYGAPLPNNVVHYVLEEVLLGDRAGRSLMSPNNVITVGQNKCDMSYPGDEGLANKHCEIAPMPNGAMIRDLSGGLGTFVRAEGERTLKVGDRIRMGQQTLQVEQL